ncbi:lactadherin-like [Argopecten irradians]|uniref:lactadherin-like n=1 Tax=Argopecten irradians TaxID=31199 RepID=UPI003720D5E1
MPVKTEHFPAVIVWFMCFFSDNVPTIMQIRRAVDLLLLATIMLLFIAKRDCHCGENLITGPYGVDDSFITASSSYRHADCQPKYVRIGTSDGAWCAGSESNTEYLQIQLRALSSITGFIIRGRPSDYVQYTKSFAVKHSLDGQQWHDVFDSDGLKKIFPANSDRTSNVTMTVTEIRPTKFIRIYPETWNNWPAFRFEITGCAFIPKLGWVGKMGDPVDLPATLHLTTSPNNGICGKACHLSVSCESFMFDFKTKECHLYSVKSLNFTESVSDSSHKVYFLKTDPPGYQL